MVETLIEHYRKHQFMPTACEVLSAEDFRSHRLKRNNLLVNKLSLPDLIWRGARVLEAGCGSGENSLIYALLGARMTFIEPLEFSIARLKELFRYYGVSGAIEQIHLEPVETAPVTGKYDLVLAEGFITTLLNKREVIRKLFDCVEDDGFLFVSTNDTTGNLIESFRASIAQLYCRNRKLTGIDEKVEAVRPFFQEDFEGIPHSRPFELWAKDVLFYPLSPNEYYYDFDRIVEDLEGLCFDYYSSWPSYRPFNDLKWHKHIPEPGEELAKALRGYRLRRPSFLFGEVQEEKASMQFALDNCDSLGMDTIREIFKATHDELRLGLEGRLAQSLTQAIPNCQGKPKELLSEMLAILGDLTPENYRRHAMLRTYWGVPNHYIVLQKQRPPLTAAAPDQGPAPGRA